MSTLKDSIIQVHPQMKDFSNHVKRKDFDQRKPYELLPEFQKSAAVASAMREFGNEAYKSKNYDKALQYYSQSVATAPTDSIELALAFGNRSAVLQLIEKYALCLLDVNRALKGPQLPDDAKKKLVDRKINCWALLQSENDTKQKLRKAMKTKEKRTLYPTERRWLYGHQMTKDEIDLKMDYSSFDDPIWRMTFDNARTPGLSPNVELVHNEEYGCHLVATKDIKAGEVISIQEPFTFLLYPSEDILRTYCSYCTILCEALIPCSNCAVEMYCSRVCRQNAYDSYHRTECKLLPYLLSCKNLQSRKVCWEPLRIFLVGTKQGLELEKLMHNPDIYDILSGRKKIVNSQHSTNDYFAILHMLWSGNRNNNASVSHSDEKEFQNFQTLLYLFELLEHVNFFDDIKKTLQNPDHAINVRLFSGLLLLHHLDMVTKFTTTVFIHLMMSSPTKVTQTDDFVVGCCAGLLQGFMNHSCECNSFHIFNRRKVLTFSARPIKSGEQIFTICGTSYEHHPKHIRSKFLAERCSLECKCKACLNDWPVMEQLRKQDSKFKTNDKDVLQKLENYYKWLLAVVDESKDAYDYKDGDLQKVLKCNQFIRQNVEEPSALICLCERITDVFMGMKGNFYFTVTQKFNRSSPLH